MDILAIEPQAQTETKGQYLTILADDAPFPWQYHDPKRGVTFATVFTLRPVSDEDQDRLQRKRTTERKAFNAATRGYDTERVVDWVEYHRDILDIAIVDWSGLKNRATGADVPCSRSTKAALPADVRTAIMEVVCKRDAPAVSDPNGSAPTSNGTPR